MLDLAMEMVRGLTDQLDTRDLARRSRKIGLRVSDVVFDVVGRAATRRQGSVLKKNGWIVLVWALRHGDLLPVQRITSWQSGAGHIHLVRRVSAWCLIAGGSVTRGALLPHFVPFGGSFMAARQHRRKRGSSRRSSIRKMK
jgi:hypothetical protein